MHLLTVLGACGGDDGEETAPGRDGIEETPDRTLSDLENLPPCDELYADGKVFGTEDELIKGYCDRDGDPFLPASVTHDCPDGRTLSWNDEGWGYLGEPFHRHEAGADQVAPVDERNACG